MKIAIFGSGGVGAYFGGRLAAAGYDVSFIARGNHFDAIRQNGLSITSDLGDVHIEDVKVHDGANSVGPVDIVLSAVKLYDADDAAQRIPSILTPEGVAISLQNGIEGPEILRKYLPGEKAITGSVVTSSFVDAPGKVKHVGKNQLIRIEDRSSWASKLHEACIASRLDSNLVDDAKLMLWQKFIRLAPLSSICALTRGPIGPVQDSPFLSRILERLIEETLLIAHAEEITLPPDTPDKTLEGILSLPPHFKPSLLRDVESQSPLESPWLTGTLCRLSEKHNLSIPHTHCAHAHLLHLERGSIGK